MQEKYFLLGACLLRHSVTERDCIEHESRHWERYQDVTSVIGMAGGGKCSSVWGNDTSNTVKGDVCKPTLHLYSCSE